MGHEEYMAMALEQAQDAFEKGEFPVGCVIVENGKVIARGGRCGTGSKMRIASEIDHAEIRALKSLEVSQIRFDPEKTALYATMEPCLMCYGAIILSGIRTIVYAYEDAMGGGTGCSFENMPPLYKNSRINMTLKASIDMGKTWKTVKVIHSGASAYSDLARIDKNTLACLYEGGIFSPYEGIVFTTITNYFF